jgi:hypothetical protein
LGILFLSKKRTVLVFVSDLADRVNVPPVAEWVVAQAVADVGAVAGLW